MIAVFNRIRAYGNLITVSHSVFALPFALLMLVVTAREYQVSWWQIVLLVVCVVAARSAAMAFNRLMDARYDAKNVRTRNREIPAGVVSTIEATALVLLSSALFVSASTALGIHCGILSIPVLIIILGYSLVKRFSSACHFVLGLSLAIAPGGVWYALVGTFSWRPIPLMLAVLVWVAGFDILYACQDVEFDTEHGLRSIPSRIGIKASQSVSVLLHVLSVALLVVFGKEFELGAFFWCGVCVFGAVVASQHLTIMRMGMRCVDRVFFTRNGIASVVLFLFTTLDLACAMLR